MRFPLRAAMVACLCLGLAPFAASAAPCAGYTDVSDADAAYCAAVTFIKNKGVTAGCTDASHFCPNDYVTRLQMALFMQRQARGGSSNTLGHFTATIGGGEFNEALYADDTVAGGRDNHARGGFSTVLGGYLNYADGITSTAAGGTGNRANGRSSLAAGSYALADSDYCGVLQFRSSTTRSMGCFGTQGVLRVAADHGMSIDFGAVRDDGGGMQWMLLGDTLGDMISTSTGAKLTTGGAWTNASDRNAKTDFADIDALNVLDKVVALPMTTWRYKLEANERHLGPMAQDFHAAFGLGADDTHITTVDEGGVALAAIKGLNDKLEHENAELRARLEAIERRLGN